MLLSLNDLLIPRDWPLLVGYDTGAYCSAVFVTFPPDPYSALVVAEFPNYRYVGGEIELVGLSNPEWARTVWATYNKLRPGTTKVGGFVDQNSQFKAEFSHYGLALYGNSRQLELRVEICREYVHATNPSRFYLAPWLSVLPYEMEHAHWPDQTTSAGKFVRLKDNDHTLDCLEHVLSRRPRSKTLLRDAPKETLREYLFKKHARASPYPNVDPHLGVHR